MLKMKTLFVLVCCALIGAPESRGQSHPETDGVRKIRIINPLLAALDADQNGKLSAKEIENAANALRLLDTNMDGQLTAREISLVPGGRSRSVLRQPRGRPAG